MKVNLQHVWEIWYFTILKYLFSISFCFCYFVFVAFFLFLESVRLGNSETALHKDVGMRTSGNW